MRQFSHGLAKTDNVEIARRVLPIAEVERRLHFHAVMHAWHDLKIGENFPEIATAVIEIPRGSSAKYKLDSETGLIKLTEILPTVARYPANYGFFPRTVAADGDALDVFVFCREALQPLSILDARVLGGLKVKSEAKGIEYKLISVSQNDAEFRECKTINDLAKFYIEELCQFFEQYKALDGEKKKVVDSFVRKRAYQHIEEAAEKYADWVARGKIHLGAS